MRAMNLGRLPIASVVVGVIGVISCGGGDSSSQGADDGGLASDAAIREGGNADSSGGTCTGTISGAENITLGCTLALFVQDGNEFLMVEPSSSSSAIDESVILLYPATSPFSTRTYNTADLGSSTKILVQGSTSSSHYAATPTMGTIQLVLTAVDPEPTAGSEPAHNTHGSLDATLVDLGDAGPGLSLHVAF